jgi:hypothetical protein
MSSSSSSSSSTSASSSSSLLSSSSSSSSLLSSSYHHDHQYHGSSSLTAGSWVVGSTGRLSLEIFPHDSIIFVSRASVMSKGMDPAMRCGG